MRALRVLLVDDEPNTCAYIKAALTAEGHDCHDFLRPAPAEQFLAANEVDLALIDVYLGDVSGLDLVRRLRSIQPDLYCVVMTAHISVETAARSTAEGAIDYVAKPLSLEQLRAVCESAGAYRRRRAAATVVPEAGPQGSAIIGKSPKMLEVYKIIARVAPSNMHVLITGPSGSGKELVARAIHQHSRRARAPFTAVNCGALTETLLESELFGHEKGAFTGAAAIHKGLVETTDQGTLFLDEITDTTLSFQGKLLRVIQEQQVRRVGSSRLIPVDVRVFAASNRDMLACIREGRFREDLYYRLNAVHIEVPALAERREDVALLVRHFLQQFNERNERNVSIEAAAVERLAALDWPGNVRELENTIHRLAVFAATGRITSADVEREAARLQEPAALSPKAPRPDRLLEMEREHIARVLAESRGNKSEAARRLGVERKTLYKKARRLGIDLHSPEKH
ncbi:MAG TPA: sigma-54 dependent transcriptional regulator [Terriglobales bacterium]|nr:sigma-54 dependent transcriptional regulator [Terriglobales bacterium]